MEIRQQLYGVRFSSTFMWILETYQVTKLAHQVPLPTEPPCQPRTHYTIHSQACLLLKFCATISEFVIIWKIKTPYLYIF